MNFTCDICNASYKRRNKGELQGKYQSKVGSYSITFIPQLKK